MIPTIYHNPRCSTSRKTLALLQEAGQKPKVIEYLKDTPNAEQLSDLISKTGLPVREIIRTKETIYKELGLDNPKLSDTDLIAAMAQHPILINRPIVVTDKGALLCRPAESVLNIL